MNYFKLFTCFLFAVFVLSTEASREEAALRKRLNEYYEETGRETRPVERWSDNVTVSHGLAMISFDFDAEKRLLSGLVWPNLQWTDVGLRWNESDYNGLQTIRMRADDLWIPDIVLYNSEETGTPMGDVPVVVYSDGKVTWIPPVTYKVKCERPTGSEDNMPQGTRFICPLKFGSWTYHGHSVDLKLYTDKVDLSSLTPNDAWETTFTKAIRNVAIYECCPEAYIDVMYKIGLKNTWL